MFKLPNSPSPEADVHELADFAELWALKKQRVSVREILAYLGRVEENDFNSGCDDNDDENAEILDETMNEVERRISSCGNGYPFELKKEGTVLEHSCHDTEQTNAYRYLLLSTRLNMKNDRDHAGINGTELLEEISTEVLRNYLGHNRSVSILFGTASKGPFQDKIANLCDQFGEGGGFRSKDTGSVDANDDRLDTVGWIPFCDGLPCKIAVFGQCKTGTSWEAEMTQLQPEAFIKMWMHDPFALDPVRALFVSEASDRSHWNQHGFYSGLFLDRCRIVDFSETLETPLIDRIKVWNQAAIESIQIG